MLADRCRRKALMHACMHAHRDCKFCLPAGLPASSIRRGALQHVPGFTLAPCQGKPKQDFSSFFLSRFVGGGVDWLNRWQLSLSLMLGRYSMYVYMCVYVCRCKCLVALTVGYVISGLCSG